MCGCSGVGSTAQNIDSIIGEDKIVYIKHCPDKKYFKSLQKKGYMVTALVTARDIYCSTESRSKQGFQDDDYDYGCLFRNIPPKVKSIVVPYEAIVLHGAEKLVEMLGLKYVAGPISIDNHRVQMIFDGNAKYYGKAKPEDSVFYEDNLIWLPEKGIGYFPVTEKPYTSDYFDKYIGYANTIIGKKITSDRARFIGKHYSGNLVDIGIGCGDFVAHREDTFGFDIMPESFCGPEVL
jgi:hypothetical protein